MPMCVLPLANSLRALAVLAARSHTEGGSVRVEEASIVMNNLKRFTVCKLAGHKWAKVGYPPSSDGETAGTFLRCQRCGKENHDAGTVARGAGPVF